MDDVTVGIYNIIGPLKQRIKGLYNIGFTEIVPQNDLTLNLSQLLSYPPEQYLQELKGLLPLLKSILDNPSIVKNLYHPNNPFAEETLSHSDIYHIITELKRYESKIQSLCFDPKDTSTQIKTGNEIVELKSFGLNNDQCSKLLFFTITGVGNNEQFIKNGTEITEERFFDILCNPAKRKSHVGKCRIIFGCENAYVAFIFYWLGVKKNIPKIFSLVEKLSFFYTDSGSKKNQSILQNNLSQAKASFQRKNHISFDEIITKKVNRNKHLFALDSDSSPVQIIQFLHEYLTISIL